MLPAKFEKSPYLLNTPRMYTVHTYVYRYFSQCTVGQGLCSVKYTKILVFNLYSAFQFCAFLASLLFTTISFTLPV